MATSKGRPPKMDNYVEVWTRRICGKDYAATTKAVEALVIDVVDKLVDKCPFCGVAKMKQARECPVCARPLKRKSS